MFNIYVILTYKTMEDLDVVQENIYIKHKEVFVSYPKM